MKIAYWHKIRMLLVWTINVVYLGYYPLDVEEQWGKITSWRYYPD